MEREFQKQEKARKNLQIVYLSHEGERMSTEIPIWVSGKIRWLSGIDKKTTCKDVVEVLLEGEGIDKSEGKDFAIMERWRKVERPLDETSKILKIWTHWGNEKKEVRLCLRRIDNEVDSGRGSPINNGNIVSIRKKRHRSRGNGKPPWANHPETVHPRRLAELGRFVRKEYDNYYQIKLKQGEGNNEYDILNNTNIGDNLFYNYEDIDNIYDNENISNRKKSGHKSYHCSGTGRLHSTPLSNSENRLKRIPKCCSKRESKQKIRNSENIEKLMKLILAQGATIQSQLQRLKEREEQIESLEHERHRERVEKNGRNYLLETYLGSLKDAEIPDEINKGNECEVSTEGGRPHTTEIKKNNTESQRSNETESDSDKCKKIYERSHQKLEHSSDDGINESTEQRLPSKLHQKSARSKSESRTYECNLDRNLKRTLSDNAIAESSDVVTNKNDKDIGNKTDPDEKQTTKESEEIIELRKIQSQIEMWEKVFKINKKLEKEEENLVRLHIKIKKFQSENYRFAKENSETNEKENKKERASCKGDLELVEYETKSPEIISQENDCVELQKNLAILRSDLEQNSKEIYQNFTRLIEEDEVVEKKRSCITKLMSDLERTDHEHHMLNEMITIKEKKNLAHDQIRPFFTNSTEIENKFSFQEIPSIRNEENNFVPNDITLNPDKSMCSIIQNLPQEDQDTLNQRTESNLEQEELKPMKPKTVKISFEDQIQNQERSENGEEKLHKETPVASGVLKSILKNKKYDFNKDFEKCNLNNESQSFQDFSQGYASNNDQLTRHKNLNVNNGYIQIQYNNSPEVSNQITSNCPFQIPYSIYNNFPNETNQNDYGQTPMTNLSEKLKTVYQVRNSHSPFITKTPTNSFPHSTIVTTRALVHNDTDSSTSSDTSGLSSMYSSSPTVEEPYVEQGYALDTLV